MLRLMQLTLQHGQLLILACLVFQPVSNQTVTMGWSRMRKVQRAPEPRGRRVPGRNIKKVIFPFQLKLGYMWMSNTRMFYGNTPNLGSVWAFCARGWNFRLRSFFDCIKLRITAVYTPSRNVPVVGVLPYIQVGPKSGPQATILSNLNRFRFFRWKIPW